MEVVMKKLGLFLTLGLFSTLQLQSSSASDHEKVINRLTADIHKRLDVGTSTGIIFCQSTPPKKESLAGNVFEFNYALKNASDIEKFWALAKEAFGDNLQAIILVPRLMAQKTFIAELVDYLKEGLVIWNQAILDQYKNLHKSHGACFVHILLSVYSSEQIATFQEQLSCVVAVEALRSLSGQK